MGLGDSESISSTFYWTTADITLRIVADRSAATPAPERSAATPELAPGSSPQLKNRDKELRTLQPLIRNLRNGIVLSHGLFNILGLPGIGKTALMRYLYAAWYMDEHLAVLYLPLQELIIPQTNNLEEIKRTIVDHLIEQMRTQGKKLSDGQVMRELRLMSANTAPNEALPLLTEHLLAQSQQARILLLVDGCEGEGRKIVEWMEAQLLRKLVLSGKALCLLASQGQLRFREFDLRRRVQSLELDLLDIAATKAQIELPNDMGDAVFQLTHGYPLANTIAHDVLDPDSPVLNDTNRKEILKRFVEAIRERIASHPSDELWQVVRVVALLREFDADMLNYLFPVMGEQFGEYNLDSALDFVQKLVDTRLIGWLKVSRARTFEPALRSLFATDIRTNDPAFFERVHKKAAEYYEHLVNNVPRGRSQFLIEYYYHSLYNPTSDLYNEHTLRSDLEERLLRYYYSPSKTYADNVSLDRLEELLNADTELQQTLEEHQLSKHLLLEVVREVRRA